MPLGLPRGIVKLVPYDPEWAKLFRKEKTRIKEELSDQALGVEHIGSTAIPGMDAKPILDLMAAVPQIEDYELYIPALERLGYQFMRDNRDNQQHILFVKGSEECRTHYLKLTTLDSDFWREHVLFRDYLIRHPGRAEEYRKLKHELLEKHGGLREKYTDDKSAFIRETLNLAEQKP